MLKKSASFVLASKASHRLYPTRREARFPRFTTLKFLTQIRHMGFRPEPFILL